MRTPSEIKHYYDKFAKRVLVRDFYYLNPRHEAIKLLCDRFVQNGETVLEIGCGVGIISKFLQKRASRVVAIDISEKNIDIARQYASSPTCEFAVVDIVEQAAELDKFGKFDAVLMADVIEHIPKVKYREQFSTIEDLLSDKGRVVLTFPSPEHQEYLTCEKPEARQLIDESIELGDILGVTALKLLNFSYRDIFGVSDYINVVLTADRSFSAQSPRKSFFDWLRYRIRKYRWRFRNLLFVRSMGRRQRGN